MPIASMLTGEEELTRLGATYRSIVDENLHLSGLITQLWSIRDHLVTEFHSKKGTLNKRGNKYTFSDDQTARCYKEAMYLKRKWYFSGDVFPSSFKHVLDCKLHQDIKQQNLDMNAYDLSSVYYGCEPGSWMDSRQKQSSSFDVKEWSMDATVEMTSHDKMLVQRWLSMYLALFRNTLSIVPDKHKVDIARELRRIERFVGNYM